MTDLPAASAVSDPSGAVLHAVDGDGSSLCQRVPAGDLFRVDDLTWKRVPRDLRCPDCQLFMTSYGMGHL